MATQVAFSSIDKIVDHKADVTQIKVGDDKESYFQLEECVQHINLNGYSTIALQFPDELMSYSAFVATQIKLKTKAKTFVLADTSYGSCCIDEVAASHYNADLLYILVKVVLLTLEKPQFYIYLEMKGSSQKYF